MRTNAYCMQRLCIKFLSQDSFILCLRVSLGVDVLFELEVMLWHTSPPSLRIYPPINSGAISFQIVKRPNLPAAEREG